MMRLFYLLLAMFCSMLASTGNAQNLLANPNFTGCTGGTCGNGNTTCQGWTSVNAASGSCWAYNVNYAGTANGQNNITFGSVNATYQDTIQQYVATTTGASYIVSFTMQTQYIPGSVTVKFGNNPPLTYAFTSGAAFTTSRSFVATATSNSTLVQFSGMNVPAWTALYNLSVTPSPATLVARYNLEPPPATWNGSTGELTENAGFTGGPFKGTAIGPSFPTQATANQAMSDVDGGVGTCGYAFLHGNAGGSFSVPGLPLSTSQSTVSFWMYWTGTALDVPIGFNNYFLQFGSGGTFGFSTGNGDIYGTSSAALLNGWHHVVATFTNGSVVGNTLFIDGAAKVLSQSGTPLLANAQVSATLGIGSQGNDATKLYKYTGYIDEVRVLQGSSNQALATALYREAHTCNASTGSTLNHIELDSSSTTGTTCAPSQITVTACANNSNPCTSYYTGGVNGTLSASGTATWDVTTGCGGVNCSTANGFVIPPGSYSVSKNVSFSTTGNYTFGLSSTTPAAASGTATCNYANTSSCTLAVTTCPSATGFNCVESTSTSGVIAADSSFSTGRLYTKVAGVPFTIDVVATQTSGTAQALTYASDGNKTVTVQLVNGTPLQTACVSSPTALSPTTGLTQTLTFTQANQPTQQGRQSVTFTVPNAFSNVRCYVSDNSATQVKGCSMDTFSIRPPLVSLVTGTAMATPPTATASPTLKAGSNFTLRATTASGTNYNPTLSLDATKLTAQLTSNVATQQAGGTVGTLTPLTLVTNAAAVNAAYTEAGYLYLAAGAYYDAANPAFTAVDSAAGDCLAGYSDAPVNGKVGCGIGSQAIAFGRFIPDHFDTLVLTGSSPTSPIGCPGVLTCPLNASPSASGMVYSNQPFNLQVTAKNASGGLTANYSNSFSNATTITAWSAKGGNSANPGSGVIGGAAIAAGSFLNGSSTAASLTYGTTLPTLLAPTDVYFRAAENAGADGITSLQATAANSVEAGLKIASGRTNVPNLVGSEKLGLCVPASVQYYTGYSWTTSLTDSATTFISDLTTATPTPGNVLVVSGNALTTGGSTPVGCPSPALGQVSNGVRNMRMASVGNATGKSVIKINSPSYLPGNSGTLFWGAYKSPVIDLREVYR